MGNPYVADAILYSILNGTSKSFQLKFAFSQDENAGEIGDYTTVDESLEKCQDSSPNSIRISAFFNPHESEDSAPPEPANNEFILWHDITNDKWYLCVGVSGGMKKVELT